MKLEHPQLFTPIYLKLAPDMPWPEHEKTFYLLAADGLHICRNHAFFRSSVPTGKFPGDLARHEPFLRLSYPKLPQRTLETIIGFFSIIGRRFSAEAAALLAWNTTRGEIEVVVPEQASIVSRSWSGKAYPIEVHYAVPPLAPHLQMIGDIHSHVDEAAYASAMDKDDEAQRPGVHIVVGRISQEPPELHIEVTVDGMRFKVNDSALVLEGYERRRPQDVPPDWLDKVTVESWSSYYDRTRSRGGCSSSSARARQIDNGGHKDGARDADSTGANGHESRSTRDPQTPDGDWHRPATEEKP